MTDQHDNSGPALSNSDDLKARPLDEVFDTMMEVEKDPYGAWEAIQTQADRIEQLEAALTQSQDLVDRWINTSSEQYQTIVEMREALTQSQTEVAAAYERAADVVDDCRRSPAFVGLGCDPIIEAIRALSTPDQTAALDTIRAEARAQGMREAAEIVWEAKDDIDLWSRGFLQNRILDAITKGDKA